ncbi:MAG TPA: DivIVA domain-containing protein [Solirubrobacteraceae bacterium]|nr:DivIVA domain-containing protein [Solirubrobacteraceae bacterium]
MPDQSTAATEHAILQEITGPLQRLPEDPVAQVHADFPTALRGYDRMAVDAYVQQVSQLVAELHASRSPESAVRRALERVGEQISGILQRAHETAEQITAQSRREAEDRLEAARAEAAEIIEAAQQHVRDLDADTDRIWIERGRIVDDARDLARELLSVVDTAAERFPEPEPAAAEVYDDAEPAGPGAEDAPVSAEVPPAPAAEPSEPESAADGDAPTEDQTRVYDDVEATVRYEPLTLDPEDEEAPEADHEGAGEEPQVRGTRASIPPASEAAQRRPRD